MRKLLIIVFIWATGTFHLRAQTVSSVTGTTGFAYHYRILSIRNLPLFDTEEIKARRITTCTVTHPLINAAKKVDRIDTLYIFNFDSTGNICRQTRFSPWDRDKRIVTDGNGSEKKYYSRIDSTITHKNGLTEVSKYYIWAFDPENPLEDTGIIDRRVYDNKRNLIEMQHNGTRDYHKIFFCGTGMTFHQKYEYDRQGNMIRYQDLDSRTYATFSHYLGRRKVRIYDAVTNELKGKYTVYIKSNSSTIIEKIDEIMILTRLSRNSKLFSMITEKNSNKDPLPGEYLFTYEYSQPLFPMEKLIVKQ